MLSPDCQVIGLTGSFGSGCTTAARALENRLDFRREGLSGILKSHWASENGEGTPDRKALQQLGDSMRRDLGRAALIEQVMNS